MGTRKGIPTRKANKPKISTKGTTVNTGRRGAVKRGNPR